jgi:hypothetical protein
MQSNVQLGAFAEALRSANARDRGRSTVIPPLDTNLLYRILSVPAGRAVRSHEARRVADGPAARQRPLSLRPLMRCQRWSAGRRSTRAAGLANPLSISGARAARSQGRSKGGLASPLAPSQVGFTRLAHVNADLG